ncbi:MAG TPA: hypothetical protein ENO36_02815 [Fervidicoccus fontis]|uniref:ParB-like N-terminal domain-containing protein n=1 Tax=Fervidicoccus fontis TaxID=683846 RepID=A0A7C2YJN7_9CREN|nr:MAG: hypothetical protein C0179_06035 [Fervidicoccus sp.]HEU97771.1 hypothetical protein [Fervidicoccus fontis]
MIPADKLINRTALAKREELLPHEKTDELTVEIVAKMMLKERVVRVPVLVEYKYGVILDGHHRVEALKRFGIELVPVYIVDYNPEDIAVFSRRKDLVVSKDEVIRRATAKDLFPHKSTRHVLRGGGIPCSIIYLEEHNEGKAPLPLVSFRKRAS